MHFHFTPAQLLQATAASYKPGKLGISGNPNTIDVGSTGGNCGSTVVGMMAAFYLPQSEQNGMRVTINVVCAALLMMIGASVLRAQNAVPSDSLRAPLKTFLRNIGVTVQGGGILATYQAVLSLNGESYPGNPSLPPARKVATIQGPVIIANTEGSVPLYD